jgi:hypothetical protein
MIDFAVQANTRKHWGDRTSERERYIGLVHKGLTLGIDCPERVSECLRQCDHSYNVPTGTLPGTLEVRVS